MIDLSPLGDRAFLARFDDEAGARRWAEAVRSRDMTGIVDVVLSYRSAAVFADPDRIDLKTLDAELRGIVPSATETTLGALIELPVLYDGEDLGSTALALHLSPKELIELHAGLIYDVFAVGFLPGFPYAGYLPERLRGLPRRPDPRTRVPAGSVAIAGKQTGVYPGESPGGWHLIGRIPLKIVDVSDQFFPIRAGDRLRFIAIDIDEYSRRAGERLGASPRNAVALS